jgi:hypothetical protein
MLFQEMVALYREIHTKNVSTRCSQTQGVLMTNTLIRVITNGR